MSFLDEKERKRLFKKRSFYNAPMEKPKLKKLSNIDMWHELPFYDESNILETTKAFKNMQEAIALK